MLTPYNTSSSSVSPPALFSHLVEAVPDTESRLGRVCVLDQLVQDPGSLFQRQILRRAEILSQTRALIGRDGYMAFNVRKLARICDIAPQTIYNLFGERNQLLSAATAQHLDAMISTASRLDNYPNFFIAFADVIWGHAVKNPTYARTVTQAHFMSPDLSAEKSQKIMHEAFRSELLKLEQQGGLRRHASIDLLGEHLSSLILATALKWVDGHTDDSLLRRQLISGVGFLLLGTLSAPARKQIEEWLENAQVLV